MTDLLTEATDVFAAAGDGRCVVAFLAKVVPSASYTLAHAEAIEARLAKFAAAGWALSPRAMIEPAPGQPATAFDTGFAHDVDMVGLFEAPSLTAALAGTVALEQAGFSRRFATQWLLGPREFAAVLGAPGEAERDWGFLALWEWNDAWSAATPSMRRDYDAECDTAFAADLAAGVNITGRHRLDWASSWHHLGFWETATALTADRAIREHERVADFKFTTSRHYLGRRRPLSDFLAVPGSMAR